jgi:glyoxylase-like metal-dependent hydrolase (beta-lactamase superfamily II)
MSRAGEVERPTDNGRTHAIAPDIAYLRDRIVNVYFVGAPGTKDRRWALVDTGLAGSSARIFEPAAERYGHGERPGAIILTHGHFDHVGTVSELADFWNVPVYAHDLELPYLTGRSSYPPPDPTVGGGAMARLARLYPRGPIDLRSRVRTLPADGSVPAMPGWRWLHTPGHAPGHVSLFRDRDRSLIAGDAFVTTKQESAISVLTQRREIHGPPAYYTPDWDDARESVRRLAALEPELAATGHGVPMRGERMRVALHQLARDFDRIARPRHGRYVHQPALMDESGVIDVPPPASNPIPKVLAGAAIVGLAWAATRRMMRGREEENDRSD